MDKKQLNSVIFFTNIVSVLVVASCVIGIVMIAYGLVSDEKKKETVNVNINYSLKLDSTYIETYKDSSNYSLRDVLSKNNEKIYSEINKRLDHFEEEYSDLLNKKRDQSDFTSLASALLGILLAIAGFFGFKSIKEMKKDAIEMSTKTAENVSKDEMREKYTNIKDDIIKTVKSEIEIKVSEKLMSELDELKNNYTKLKSQLKDCCKDTTDDVETTSDNQGGVDESIPDNDLFSDEDLNK